MTPKFHRNSVSELICKVILQCKGWLQYIASVVHELLTLQNESCKNQRLSEKLKLDQFYSPQIKLPMFWHSAFLFELSCQSRRSKPRNSILCPAVQCCYFHLSSGMTEVISSVNQGFIIWLSFESPKVWPIIWYYLTMIWYITDNSNYYLLLFHLQVAQVNNR